MKKLVYYLFAITFTSVIVSCSQNDTVTPNQSTIDDLYSNSASDDAYADEVMNTVSDDVDYELSLADEGGFTSNLKSAELIGGPGCRPKVTVDFHDSTQFPKVITFEFSDTCETLHGLIRSGKVIVTISNFMWVEGSTRVTTYENFYVDSCKIEGIQTTQTIGKDENGNWQQTVSLANGKIILPDETEITRNTDFVKTWLQIPSQRQGRTGSFELTGSANGQNIDGVGYEMEITTPLHKEVFCPWFGSGVKNILLTDGTQIQLDYGDGTCDNAATLTVNGESTEILIGRQHRIMHKGNS